MATVLGAGTSIDAWNATAPHPQGWGAEQAMRRALADAGLSSEQVDYVNAHGTGTPLGDKAESAAIYRVFGDTVVSSIKGAIGHTIAAAGAVEAAACIEMLEQGFLAGTVGLEKLCPQLECNSLKRSVSKQVEVVLSNSFGFGGQNCSLIFGRAMHSG